ncbi:MULTISPECIES: FtsX-like permease family protein [unclassified Curtobacterium]|uniref:ABC transporter permease n=1 Tax=unclassified Curtobacterium TaxID=257496 RepID=UPI0037FDABDF
MSGRRDSTGGRRRPEAARPDLTVRTPLALRTAIRLGRRLAFARLGRAALIVALIGVPTAGFAAAAVVVQSTKATTVEGLDYSLGHAAAQMRVVGPDLAGMRQDPVDWQVTDTRRNSPAFRSSDADQPWTSVLDHVPSGAVSIPVGSTNVVVDGPKGPVALPGTEGSTWDDALDGHWRVLSGSVPTTPAEVMVTPATLERLDARIGDTVDVTDPMTKRFTITGTMRDLGATSDAQGVYLPWGTTLGSASDATGVDPYDLTVYLATDAPTWSEIRALNAHGIVVESRPVVLDPPDDRVGGQGSGMNWYLAGLGLIGVFALFEVALLAGAAFLVGTRAEARSYAILASVGGDRRFVRTVVAGSGLVLGVTAAVLGVAAGIGIGRVAFGVLDDGDVTAYPGFHVPVLLLLAIAGAGVLAGLVSSLVAARAATRIDVLSALRGSRRPVTPSRKTRARRRTWGPVLVVVGAVMTLACGVGVLMLNDRPVQHDDLAWLVGAGVALGPCLVQLGVVLCAPEVLAAAARSTERLGLAPRLAARDARRNPIRTVPVLASVMSVVFVASVVMTWTASSHAAFVRDYEYRTAVGVATADVSVDNGGYDAAVTRHAAEVVGRVLDHDRVRVLGVAQEQTTEHPGTQTLPHDWQQRDCPTNDTTTCSRFLQSTDSSAPHIWAGTADDLAVLTGHRTSAAVTDALASGRAVSLWPEYVHDGAVRIDTFEDRDWDDPLPSGGTRPDASVSIPAVLDVQSPRIMVGVFMTPETARAHGVPVVDGMLVTRLPGQLTTAQWDDLNSAWQARGGADRDAWGGPAFSYEAGPVDGSAPVMTVALALAAAVTIGATGVAVGLARADGRRDDEVLDAVGAAPRLRRRISTWQAAILSAVGAVIGTALGLLPIRALTLRFSDSAAGVTHTPFAPDWTMLVLLALGLPVVVTLGTWLTSGRRSRPTVRRAP